MTARQDALLRLAITAEEDARQCDDEALAETHEEAEKVRGWLRTIAKGLRTRAKSQAKPRRHP